MSQVRGVRLFSILPLTFFLLSSVASAARLEVAVYDEHTREPIPGANLALTDSARIEVSDERGTAFFELQPGWYPLRASHVGYEATEKEIRLRGKGAVVRFFLIPRAWEVDGAVTSVARQPEVPGGVALSAVEIRRYPGPTPDPVRFVKVLPGVASGNDFSSAYSVQGGSYAENLVYVNGVEVEAPLQIRRGLAETFSLVNPAMIGRVNFRAGSFPVRYGDRLSSVLDVDYRLPEERLEGSAELSALQQNLTLGRRVGAVRF
ncbi:MAG: TonB-dependent receptor plug domain-containing protein, partial [Gemmatimonadetes bacterium]|nr:TonB-dependent receptor plug domain-containing protein [Gemmatimonadota bacterium]